MGGKRRTGYSTELPGANVYTVPCPIIHALNLIGGKWKLPVLWHLFDAESVRYNELKRSVVGITNIMLTQCLRELEAAGLVSRNDFGEVPALRELYKWGEKQLARTAEADPPSS